MPWVLVWVLLFAGCGNEGGDNSDAAQASEAMERMVEASAPRAESVDEDEAAAETRLTRVRFLTLRNRTDSDDPAQFFGDARDRMRAGYCEVVWTPIRGMDTIARNAPIYIPSEDQEITAVIERPLETFWSELVSDSERDRPLLFVHGYNIGFEKGCLRAARLIENLGRERELVLFSWPSDGDALNYIRDEADLAWSIDHLRQTLQHMETLFGRGGFDVAAHSLGARGMVMAMSSLAAGDPVQTPLVGRLVLFAADIDADLFRQNLPRLVQQAQHITAYVSGNDSPLALSRELHGYPRLGEAGSHLAELTEVEFIDVSQLSLRRVSGHLYHLYNPPVSVDLRELLIEQRTAADRSLPRQPDPTLPNYWLLPESGTP